MKKVIKIFLKALLALVILIFALLLIIPTFFREPVKNRIVQEANSMVNAKLEFDDFSISLIRNFPNLSFRLEGLNVNGVGPFEGQTLAGFKSFGFVFDLGSMLGKDGYRLKSLILDEPVANAIVLADGTANWDIMKPMEDQEQEPEVINTEPVEKSESVGDIQKELKVVLEQIAIKNGHITYLDNGSDMAAEIGSFNLVISGNFSESITNLLLDLKINGIDVWMGGERYLNKVDVLGVFDVEADLEEQVFTLTDNTILVNDLSFYINGSVDLNETTVATNLKIGTGDTEFKSLLSMVPTFFMSDYKDLRTEGAISLDINVDGVYSVQDSILPDVDAILAVKSGTVWYNGKPEMISDLNLNAMAGMKGDMILGNVDLNIARINLDEIMVLVPSDTSSTEEIDTIAMELELIEVPDNIDFSFDATITEFLFGSIIADNISTSIKVKDGALHIDNTGMNILGGEVSMDGLYDTRDMDKPLLDANLSADGIGIKSAYENFNTVRKLAPIAEGMDGTASVSFGFNSLLQNNMMPILNSINGKGILRSEEIELVNSSLFNKFSAVLSLDDKFSNTFKDVNVEFRVDNGRVYFKPFNTKLGNLVTVVGGDHGLDQTINYMVTSSIPSADLPSSIGTLVSGLAAQAKMFGLDYTPPEVFDVNVAISGTVKDPKFRPSLGKPGESAGTGIKDAAKKVVEEKVAEVKEQVKEEVDKQVDIAIAEAEKQAENIKDEASKAAQLIRDEASVQAKKLTDEAESKGVLAKIAAKKASETIIKEADKKASKLESEAAIRADKLVEDAKKKAGK